MPESSTPSTRRDFLKGIGAAALGGSTFFDSTNLHAVELPSATAFAQRDVPYPTVTERVAALDKIAALTDRSSEADDRKLQAVEIQKIVADYTTSTEGASDFSIKELERAKEVNYIKINMLHYSSTLGEGAADFITTVALPFYEAQVPVLRQFREDSPDKAGEVNKILNTIRGDITWCQNHKLPEVAVCAAKSMADLFMRAEDCDSLMVYRNLSTFDDPRFPLKVFLEKRELAETLIKDTLDDISKGKTEKGADKVKALFEVHDLLRNALEKCGDELMSEQAVTDLKKWLQEHVAVPVFEQIVPMYDLIYGKSSSNSFDLHDHAARLAQTIDTNLVATSNQYVSDLKVYCAGKETDVDFRLSAYRLLMHLAPDPAGTRFIAEDLEELLVNKRDASSTPGKITASLGALLLADYNHCLEAGAESKFNAGSATDVVRTLLDNSVNVTRVDPPLPPSHALLTKIFRAGISEDAATGFPELASVDPEVKGKISSNCFDMTLQFVRDISRACPRDLHSRKTGTVITYAPIPEAWGGPAIVVRDPDNSKKVTAFTENMRHFYRLADIAAVKLAELPSGIGRKEAMDRMVRTLDLADHFEFTGNNSTSESIYRSAQTSLPYLSLRTEDTGPFAHAFKRAQSLLYRKVLGRDAPPTPSNDAILGRNPRGHDKQLDTLALDYARTAEERFMVDLTLTLLAKDNSQRPIESQQSLSEKRMQLKLAVTANQLGFVDRYVSTDRHSREYRSNNPAANNLGLILTKAPGEEFRAALEARSKKLLQDQTGYMKQIQAATRR